MNVFMYIYEQHAVEEPFRTERHLLNRGAPTVILHDAV
jgi:hypothetical protein